MTLEQDILHEAAHKLILLKDKKACLEQKIKNNNTEYEEAEEELFDIMFNLNISLIHIEGRTLSLNVEEYPRVIDKNRFFKWLRDNGHGELIREVVNDKTLRSWFKENRDNIPEEIILSPNTAKSPEGLSTLLQVYKDKKIRIRKLSK